MPFLPCILCGEKLDQRTDKNGKFYFVCNPCGTQFFIRRTQGKEKLKELMHELEKQSLSILLALLKDPVRTLVLLGILTGMRIGEILGLRRKDVDFRSGQIRIEQACYRGSLGSPKTKGSRRTLPLPRALVSSLIRIYEHAPRTGEDDLVFQTRNGTPLNDTNLLHRHLKPAGWEIGMPSLSWHTLRRTMLRCFKRRGLLCEMHKHNSITAECPQP